MHLTVTDLPVPEPPMTTTLSACSTSRSMPSSTTLRPKDFFRPRTEILGTEILGSAVLDAAILGELDMDGAAYRG